MHSTIPHNITLQGALGVAMCDPYSLFPQASLINPRTVGTLCPLKENVWGGAETTEALPSSLALISIWPLQTNFFASMIRGMHPPPASLST